MYPNVKIPTDPRPAWPPWFRISRPVPPPDFAIRAAFWCFGALLSLVSLALLVNTHNAPDVPAMVLRQHITFCLGPLVLSCLLLACVGPFRSPPARPTHQVSAEPDDPDELLRWLTPPPRVHTWLRGGARVIAWVDVAIALVALVLSITPEAIVTATSSATGEQAATTLLLVAGAAQFFALFMATFGVL